MCAKAAPRAAFAILICMENPFKRKASLSAAIGAAAALGAVSAHAAEEVPPSLLSATEAVSAQPASATVVRHSTDTPPPIKAAYPLRTSPEMQAQANVLRAEAEGVNGGTTFSVGADYRRLASSDPQYADALIQGVDGKIFSAMQTPEGVRFLDDEGNQVLLGSNAIVRVLVRDRDQDYFEALSRYGAGQGQE